LVPRPPSSSALSTTRSSNGKAQGDVETALGNTISLQYCTDPSTSSSCTATEVADPIPQVIRDSPTGYCEMAYRYDCAGSILWSGNGQHSNFGGWVDGSGTTVDTWNDLHSSRSCSGGTCYRGGVGTCTPSSGDDGTCACDNNGMTFVFDQGFLSAGHGGYNTLTSTSTAGYFPPTGFKNGDLDGSEEGIVTAGFLRCHV